LFLFSGHDLVSIALGRVSRLRKTLNEPTAPRKRKTRRVDVCQASQDRQGLRCASSRSADQEGGQEQGCSQVNDGRLPKKNKQNKGI
jgi:hypothetical protein